MKLLVMSGGNHPYHQTTPILIHFLISGGHQVELSEDPNYLMSYNMTGYDALVYNTRRIEDLTLTHEQRGALTRYVGEGKGFISIHCAGGLPESWPEYHGLTGGGWLYGSSTAHPPLPYTVNVADAEHPCAEGIEDFTTHDEVYMKIGWRPGNDVFLTTVCEGETHPMAWSRRYDKGKVISTTLGHYGPAFQTPEFQRLILNAVTWVTSAD